jgi:serine/threonine protein kinase
MSHITCTEVRRYLPQQVKRIIATGGGCWIGEIDDTTVLKYPQIRGDMSELRIEAKMLEVLGQHPHIVQSKGLTEDGLLLEFAPNGNLHHHLTAHPETPVEQRMVWCLHLTKAVHYIHTKRILHCDIRHDNLLLDSNLNLKLADFQGQHFSKGGEILLDGLSLESTKAYLPRTPPDHARVKSDLFALGSALYFIMMGHEVFPELDHMNDDDEIERRFRAGEFPKDLHACSEVTQRCWKQTYLSAQQVLTDLEAIQDLMSRGEKLNLLHKDGPVVSEESFDHHTTPWLMGLCEGTEVPRVPPQIRQLVDRELL